MELKVHRFEYGDKYTIGRLYVDGVYECFTLEDKVRGHGVKVWGETAIPSGTYSILICHSPHFKKDLPHLLNVPNFNGVLIHSGNTSKDTEGCILVGASWSGSDFIGSSRKAFDILFEKLNRANNKEEPIEITIEDTDINDPLGFSITN